MNQLYILLGIGILLLGAFAAAVVVRILRPESEKTIEPASTDLSQVLPLPALNFPCAALLFHRGDYEFLASAPCLTPLAKELARNRKRLVGKWLRLMQGDVLALWRFRRLLSRHGVTTGLAEEATVAVSALSVLAILFLTRLAVFVAGPFALIDILQATPRLAEIGRRACARAFAQLPDSHASQVRAGLQGA